MTPTTGLYERILVPTDGSEGAETAARGAISIAESVGATVEALHVVPVPDVPAAFEGDYQKEVRAQAEEVVSAVAELGAERGVNVDTSVLTSRDPEHEVIVHCVHEWNIDCVVMGTTGRSGMRRLALGSVAERTVRSAPVPVITFHAEATFPREPARLLVPTDGSDGANAAVDHAIDLAVAYDAALHVLHAVDMRPMARSETPTLYDSLHEIGEAAIEDVRNKAREAGVRSVEASIVSGRPDESIVEYVRQRDIDAVVMGTHGRTGLRRLWLGSVTERVIRASPAPVVAVKPEASVERLPKPEPVISTK